MLVEDRTAQGKTATRSSAIAYLSHTNSPPSITFSASGRRYTYDLPSSKALDTILFLIRSVTAARGFVFAKRIGRLSMAYDFYPAYCAIHRAVYGRDPCTREQWAEWVRQPSSPARPLSDTEFDYTREAEGDAQ